jgi:hypothetical protein
MDAYLLATCAAVYLGAFLLVIFVPRDAANTWFDRIFGDDAGGRHG